jgi:FkbM family methyltransferase
MLMLSLPGVVVRSKFHDHDVSFFINNQNDIIQRHHFKGEFYEMEELKIISGWIAPGEVLLDIGANIGNHTIYSCKMLRIKQSIVIEPNPLAIEMLKINVNLNVLNDVVDMSLLGVGFSDAEKMAVAKSPENNLGAARMDTNDPHGSLRLLAGDSVVRGRKIDFIKMDVEGSEIAALRGLRGTIEDSRPKMFIEVENHNFEKFSDFISSNKYSVAAKFKRYADNENFLVIPAEIA